MTSVTEDVHMKDETGTEEDDTEDSSAVEEEEMGDGGGSLQKAKQALTCRNVTLNTLIDDGIIEAGKGVLSIDYLGQRFEADLLPNGKIKWHGSEDEFGTPSAWALHCKRLVNPIKRSGCGWASVKYKGKKLDIWKSTWARKHRTASPFKSHLHSPGQSSSSHSSQFSPAQSTSTPTSPATSLSPPSSANGGKTLTSTPVKADGQSSATNANKPVEDSPSTSTKVLSLLSPVPVATSSSLSLPSSSSSSSPSTSSSLPSPKTSSTAKTKTAMILPPAVASTSKAGMPDDADTIKDNGSKGGNSSAKRMAPGQNTKAFVAERKPSNSHSLSPQKPGPSGVVFVQPAPPGSLSLPGTPKKSSMAPPRLKDNLRGIAEVMLKERKAVRYSSLGMRTADVDLTTLIKCELFEAHDKIQPFNVSLTTNAALLMDFHCHLTRSEVVGYLGGKWDSQRQHLSIDQSFPVLCRLSDKLKAPIVENEIRRRMRIRKMTLVGWYHSHPYCTAQPSIRDLDCQMSYQLKMRGNSSTYHPCIGLIEAPYERNADKNMDSCVQGFWVMPNLEHPSAYNIPMHIAFSLRRDLSLTEDILIDMRRLTEFYSGAPDRVRFKERWKDSVTYLDKIRACLASKLPEDQLSSGTFLDYMQQLIKDMK